MEKDTCIISANNYGKGKNKDYAPQENIYT